MPPDWLELVAWISLTVAVVCAVVILIDIRIRGYRQPMAVMEWVWPITALSLGPFGLEFYWRAGRRGTPRYQSVHGEQHFPHWVRVGVSATHCGGGCTLGDIIAETAIYIFGISFFGAAIWASFALDYTFAMVIGMQIGMTIGLATSYPMNALLIKKGVKEAM